VKRVEDSPITGVVRVLPDRSSKQLGEIELECGMKAIFKETIKVSVAVGDNVACWLEKDKGGNCKDRKWKGELVYVVARLELSSLSSSSSSSSVTYDASTSTTSSTTSSSPSSDDSDRLNCIVCTENPRAVLFVECTHLVCCEVCASKLNLCPICRGKITTKIKATIS